MKVLSTFEISKGFDRWLQLIEVDLKPLLEKYKAKVHFACANDDQTRVYDLSELEDPSVLPAFLEDKEVQRLRSEAGVRLETTKVLSSISQYKSW